ncbi:MAG: hypothetical protein ACXWNF_10690 [Isosphaeraceae bacterium]
MNEPTDWALGYAQQANADFRAWELYEQHPEAVAAECHKLLFLQMACEKLCKAHLIRGGTPVEVLQSSHGYVAKQLPTVIKRQIILMRQNLNGMQGVLTLVRHLAEEIDVLNPSVRRDGRRPDNCEYPWEAGGQVVSPLNWSFHPLRLCTRCVCVMCQPDEPLSNSSARRLTESSMNWSTEMSGPIVRRYGFPNFEKIFGKRPLEHGVDEPEENELAVKGDEEPSGSTPASRAIPKAPVQNQPPEGK